MGVDSLRHCEAAMGRSGHNETTIEELRSALAATHCDLYARYRIRSLGVFGSRVRGDARPDSDVDVLVDFDRAPTFFELDIAASRGRRAA